MCVFASYELAGSCISSKGPCTASAINKIANRGIELFRVGIDVESKGNLQLDVIPRVAHGLPVCHEIPENRMGISNGMSNENFSVIKLSNLESVDGVKAHLL